MYDGYYEEHGIERDAVVINMSDLTGDSLIKVFNIIKEDAEGDENIHAARRINEYLKTEHDL